MSSNTIPTPKVPNSTFTEREGVGYVAHLAPQIGLIWREIPNTDLGVDGYLEAVVNDAPIGLIAVQVRSGPSYIEAATDESFTLRIEKKHLGYWLNYRLPVITIVYEPGTKTGYWSYIQDYFAEHNRAPDMENKVPIRISKTSRFDETARGQLTRIAATLDSTAYAMLARHANRYSQTHDLLTNREMLELYIKRGWLGTWLPLDSERECLLVHSALAGRGPVWYWFRNGSQREYVNYLIDALQRHDYRLKREAALALAAKVGRQAIPHLRGLLQSANGIFIAAEAFTFLSEAELQDRAQFAKECLDLLEESDLSRDVSLKLLFQIAKIGGSSVRQQTIERYSGIVRGFSIGNALLRNAGCLWSHNDLPKLRDELQQTKVPVFQALIITALAQIGERHDLEAVLNYITVNNGNFGWADVRWLAQQMARLFDFSDLDNLRKMLQQANTSLQIVADVALSRLCQVCGEKILVSILTDPLADIRVYAAESLAVKHKSPSLTEHLSGLFNLLKDDAGIVLTQNRGRLVTTLAATGDWKTIERLLEDENRPEDIIRGLRFSPQKWTFDFLFKYLQTGDVGLQLIAGESLAMVGNEFDLQQLVEWLLEHPYENCSQIIASVVNYLDHRLYCPLPWPMNTERDFSLLRFSVTRDEI